MPQVANRIPIGASADQVWQVLADFGGVAKWAPSVVQSRCSTEIDRGAGAKRVLTTSTGHITEEVIVGWNPSLFVENLALLVGRAPSAEYLAEIKTRALSVPGVLGVRDLRAEYIGPGVVHAGMSIVVARGTPIEQAHAIAEEAQQRVHAHSEAGFCVIHIEPAETPLLGELSNLIFDNV